MIPISSSGEPIVGFLRKVDALLKPPRKLDLYLGGGAAVLLAYGGRQATVDVDAIGSPEETLGELRRAAGRNSDIHRVTRYYLDLVPEGMFPHALGWRARSRLVDIPDLKNLRVHVLDPYDLVISKLGPKRFGPKDREDIRDVCDNARILPEVLREKYREARETFDRDEQDRMDENFRYVETEFLGLTPTAS